MTLLTFKVESYLFNVLVIFREIAALSSELTCSG